MSKRNTNSSRTVTSKRTVASKRVVFNPTEYRDGTYERTHAVADMNMSIRREDTRHGGKSEVVINRGGKALSLSLREARSLKAFLDRELEVRAR